MTHFLSPRRAILLALSVTVLSGCASSPPKPGDAEAPDLEGTSWRLVTVVGTELVSGGTIAFAEDGAVSGNTGCNEMSGTYTLAGGAFEIGPLAMTRRACTGVADTTERAFVAALSAARGATVVGDDLVLIDDNDVPLARLAPL